MSSTDTDTKYASLPFDPLWEKAKSLAGANAPVGPAFTALDFASMTGHNVKAVQRWQARGVVPWTSADRAAVGMGIHPMAVWGYDWLEVKDDYDDIASGKYDDVIERALKKVGARMEADLIDALTVEALAGDANSIFINDEGEVDFDPEIPMSMSDAMVMGELAKR